MKKVLLTISIVMALTLAGAAMAGDMRLSASLGGELAMPVADFGNIWDMGVGGNGRIGLEVSPKLEIGLTVSYSSLGTNIDGLIDETIGPLLSYLEGFNATVDVGGEGGDLSMFGVLSDVRFFIPVGAEDAPFRPYLTASGGLLNVSIDDITLAFEAEVMGIPFAADTATAASASESAVAFGAGGGFEYMFSPTVGIWVDAKFMLTNLKIQIPGYNENIQPVVMEFDVAYMPIRAGLKFMFGG